MALEFHATVGRARREHFAVVDRYADVPLCGGSDIVRPGCEPECPAELDARR